MVAMALVSGIAQNRGNTTMARAMDAVVDIDTRVVAAVRWRGGTETAVNMIMGGAVTTDAVLAQQYDARHACPPWRVRFKLMWTSSLSPLGRGLGRGVDVLHC